MNIFSINEKGPTNKTLDIIVTLPDNIINYTYKIYENDNLINSYDIIGNTNNIKLEETGKYQIIVEAIDINNNITNYKSGYYIIDKIPPIITLCEKCYEETGDYLNGVSVYDNYDLDITKKITTNFNELDLKKDGNNKLIYTVSDTAGNTTSKTLEINVVENNLSGVLVVEILIIVLLFIIISFILKYIKIQNLEKRYGKYSIKKLNNDDISLFEKITNIYISFCQNISKYLNKSVFLTNYSKKYNKYVLNNCTIFKNSMDIMSSKLNVALLFLILALISLVINLSSISFFKLLIPFIIGFTIPDLLYFIKYKKYVSDIENDLLQAIIIMNNAFKSGRSITQAIDLVASELSGPISDEFKKIGIELSSGLDLSVSFKRFANRINVEEVTYLTASLSILNKTGGNIIKVFSSIEHSLFMKKKLNLELRSLTSSSKIIIKVLFAVPLLFVLFVSLITPTYFMPFINTKIGLIILLFMVIYYIIYIVVVSKVMKVRM